MGSSSVRSSNVEFDLDPETNPFIRPFDAKRDSAASADPDKPPDSFELLQPPQPTLVGQD